MARSRFRHSGAVTVSCPKQSNFGKGAVIVFTTVSNTAVQVIRGLSNGWHPRPQKSCPAAAWQPPDRSDEIITRKRRLQSLPLVMHQGDKGCRKLYGSQEQPTG